MNKTKKPFYKKWWFIGIIVFVILGVILSPSEEEKQAAKDIEIAEAKSIEAEKAEKALDKLKAEMDKRAVAKTTPMAATIQTLPPVTSESVKTGESLQTYIDGTLEPLVRSVSSNIDVNWGFYMIEPFERLEAGGSIEPFHSDIGLLDSLYTGIIKQIDESKTPDHFTEKDIKDINEIKSELKNSINKRIEVIDILMEIPNREKALNTDTLKVIEKSNEHLKKAVNAYMALGK